MNTKRLLIIALTAFGLAGCSAMSDTWDWMTGDDDEMMTEVEVLEEEELEEELEEEAFEEDFGEDEFAEDDLEGDEYGDEPLDDEEAVSAGMQRRDAIYFDYKSVAVDASGLNVLQMHAQYLQANPDVVVRLEGHTDSVAPSDYNKRLSMRRAQAVARVLIQMGASSSQIEAVGLGEGQPAAREDDKQGSALNRRVELIYL